MSATGTSRPTRRARARGSREAVVGSAAMLGPLLQRPLVELGEVGVVGGQLRVAGGVDARPLVEDQVGARLVLVGVAVELLAAHAHVEPQAHEPVQRPLQRVAPVHRAAAGLGLGQLPVPQEEGGHEQSGHHQVQEHPLGGQQPGEHGLDCNRRRPSTGGPGEGAPRAAVGSGPPGAGGRPLGRRPGRPTRRWGCLRWSAAVRGRLVSPQTVVGTGAVRRGPADGPPGDRPAYRTRTRRQRAVARGSRLARVAALGLLGVLALTGCTPNNAFWRWGWPDGVTDESVYTRDLWIWSVIAALIVGFLVWGLIGWSVVMHRKRGDELPKQTAYNLPLEIVYTIIPFLIIAGLFFFTVVVQNRVQERSADPDVTIAVNAFKWNWQFVYPETTGADGEPVNTVGTSDEIPILVLPTNQDIRFEVASADVIHSFWVPEFLFKLDVIPGNENGRDNVFEVTIREEGAFVGRCAELCGI